MNLLFFWSKWKKCKFTTLSANKFRIYFF